MTDPCADMSRMQRYAAAVQAPFPLGCGPDYDRVKAVMTVADAEIAQVQDEAEGWAQSSAEAFGAWHAAEAKLARIEALADWFEQQENWKAWGIHAQLRAALNPPGGRLHGSGCVDCDNGVTEFHRSRTDKPNRLRTMEQSRIPLHRSGDAATVARCGTCDGGGCLDCTDPA